MWWNYAKLAFRTLKRNRIYAGVSVAGLGLGISCCLLIALYISNELGFESMHEKRDRIYRGYVDLMGDDVIRAGVSPMAMGPTLITDYPEISAFVRMVPMGQEVTLRTRGQLFQADGFWFTDSSFFEVFSFEVLHGDARQALVAPNSLVLTESMSNKLFGQTAVIDSLVKVNNGFYRVKAVVRDPEVQTEVQFTALASLSTWPDGYMQQTMGDWYWLVSYTYFLTHQPLTSERAQEITEEMKLKYVVPFQQSNGVQQDAHYYLRPLKGLHFYTDAEYDRPKGNRSYLYIFGLVGLFILLIAGINFINLSLAQGGKRALEVGLRKTLGASAKEVRKQFLGESLLVALLATLAGWALVEMMLPIFNRLTEKQFDYFRILRWDFLLGMLIIWLMVGVLSGSYPALVLSRLQAVRVLKGQRSVGGQGIGLFRKILVVIQFTFSLLMIIGTLVVYQQMQFMRDQQLGFRGDQVLSLELPQDTAVMRRATTMRAEFSQMAGVESACLSRDFPGQAMGELLFRIEQQGVLKERGIKFMVVDEYFLETYGIALEKGRTFKREGNDQQTAFIINQTAAERFGWGDQALGKRMQWGLFAADSATNDGRVVGVVEDFHYASLHNPIEPMVFRYEPTNHRILSVKLQKESMAQTIAQLETQWAQLTGGFPFEFEFVDDAFNKLYRSEERMLMVFGYFAFISIFIAILGLFALSSFTVSQRMKEIGIRKILGASTQQIITLIVKDFLPLVLMAFLIASPVAYYALNQWLEDFAYRMDISPLLFLLAGVMAVTLAVLTIVYHSLKAAKSDPVKALRYE